jgi:hypothetical protein
MTPPSGSHPAATAYVAHAAIDDGIASTTARRTALAAHRSRKRLDLDPFQLRDGFATRCRRALGAWLARARATPAA